MDAVQEAVIEYDVDRPDHGVVSLTMADDRGMCPLVYNPKRHPKQIYDLALLGWDNERIAEFLGIEYTRFMTWLERFPGIRQSLDNGRAGASAQVAGALYRKACGATSKEVLQEVDPATGEMKVTKVITKTHPPDTGAICFFLKNRQPDQWKETKNLKVEGGGSLDDLFADTAESVAAEGAEGNSD